MCPRPRERRSGAQLSRLSLLLGFVSMATLVTAFVSNVWIYTREPVKLPNVDLATTVTFKIGFWRVCPQLKRAPNMTRREYKPFRAFLTFVSWLEKFSDWSYSLRNSKIVCCKKRIYLIYRNL